jgi:cation transport regulator
MPYKENKDLPDSVRNVLPKKAQTIFRKAFNNAHEQYHDPKKRQDPHESTETVAMKVAWNAVKNSFYKNAKGQWVEKQN